VSRADGATAREWSLAEVHDVVSAAVPDREMVVWGDVRRTFDEVRRRSGAWAGFLHTQGFGTHRERAELQPWECGQDRIAVLAHNCPEHVEALLGCWKARTVPCNVNYQYTEQEIADLLRMLGARGAIYERALGPKLRDVVDDLDLLVEIDDGSTTASRPGSIAYESLVREPAYTDPGLDASPDDLHVACTGGTTGRPKAVLWRQGDLFVAAMGGDLDLDADGLRARAVAGAGSWFPTSPLMHVAAQWTTFLAANMGATVVFHDDRARFDPATILGTAAREHVNMMTIVGDAYARPLVEELQQHDYDLSALAVIGTGGAPTGQTLKLGLMQALPHITVRDGYGASEIGVMASGVAAKDTDGAQPFTLGPSARILDADRGRFLDPAEDEIGWMARSGHVPLGYLDDEAATRATYPVVDGVRLAVPGDRACFTADGQVLLLGRDSLVVNTGGEKVFVEEVEDVLKQHDAVVDALVAGRPHERFGQEVVAIVQLDGGTAPTGTELRDWCCGHLARYKAPRAFVFVETVRRHASGKADYRWAREQAAAAVEAV
jgi:3-oxocholest-4-en-26-oate---CoA ligase